jgi:hydroxymethylpyrimidine pyrophosphatase-like HAD family hydrolase
MKYKLFGIDLDGTLLSKNKKISAENLKAISRYVNDGGIPVIITGRSFVSSKKYVSEIEEYTQTEMPFLIGFNGAYIYDRKNHRIYKEVIDKNVTNHL